MVDTHRHRHTDRHTHRLHSAAIPKSVADLSATDKKIKKKKTGEKRMKKNTEECGTPRR